MSDKIMTMRRATLCLPVVSFPIVGNCVTLAEMLRGPFKGKLNGYGGMIEPHDKTVRSATVRELLEESGLRTSEENIEPAAVVDFHNYKEGRWWPVRVYISTTRQWEGTPHAGDGMGLPEMHPFGRLPFERMMLGDRIWLPPVLEGKKVYADIWYKEGFTDFKKEPVLQVLSQVEFKEKWLT